jgi:hypothetical protein
MAPRGGVLIRIDDVSSAGVFEQSTAGGRLAFIPADVALRVAVLSAMTPVIGLKAPGLGLALADSEVVTVLSLLEGPGARRAAAPATQRPRYDPGAEWPVPGARHAIICHVAGTSVALVGGTIVATGLFGTSERGEVLWRGEPVAALDVSALYAQAEAAIWAARAVAGVRTRTPIDPATSGGAP